MKIKARKQQQHAGVLMVRWVRVCVCVSASDVLFKDIHDLQSLITLHVYVCVRLSVTCFLTATQKHFHFHVIVFTSF